MPFFFFKNSTLGLLLWSTGFIVFLLNNFRFTYEDAAYIWECYFISLSLPICELIPCWLTGIQIFGLICFIWWYTLYARLSLFSFFCYVNCVSTGFFLLAVSFINLDDIWWILKDRMNLSSLGWQGVKVLPWREINECPCTEGKCCSRENESRYSLNETLVLSLFLSLRGENNYLKEKHCNRVLVVLASIFFLIWNTLIYQRLHFSKPLK